MRELDEFLEINVSPSFIWVQSAENLRIVIDGDPDKPSDGVHYIGRYTVSRLDKDIKELEATSKDSEDFEAAIDLHTSTRDISFVFDKEFIERTLQRLQSIPFPIFIPDFLRLWMILDGTRYSLSTGHGVAGIFISWAKLPSEWSELGNTVEALLDYARKASTSDETEA